jgi:hypothetical protein
MPNERAEPGQLWGGVQWKPDAIEAMQGWARRIVAKEGKEVKITEGKRGEELFQLILSGIREIYDVDAVIAGGAVRDFAAGISTPKDVDVFIPMKWKEFAENCDQLGWQGDILQIKRLYKGCVIFSSARAMSKVQNVPVDIVFVNKPLDKDQIALFPVHAQRCVWTLNEGLNLSPEAKQDIENKTFTIDPTITDRDKLATIIEKVNGWRKRKEYAGWTTVLPDVKDWWEVKEAVEKKETDVEKHLREFDEYLVDRGVVIER